MDELNYFTCTLGQAAVWNELHPHRFFTVNDLIDEQAKKIPNDPAVGFPSTVGTSNIGPWAKNYVTYSELKIHTISTAAHLAYVLQLLGERQTRTVALLSSSSPEFILAWLGLIRLGLSVVLIAPQCQVSAIQHLCEVCGAAALFTDMEHSEKAERVAGDIVVINIGRLLRMAELDHSAQVEGRSDPSDIAYLHHTSGTSTGLPKPIPQSHHAAVGVLPCLPDGARSSTFSTTPLYHGGIADCFRAWTSGAMIWLFPEKNLPITGLNIMRCLDSAAVMLPLVRYFSSVPYVLQMLSEEAGGLAMLQKMSIVGVGGAALPPVVGDQLVRQGINLISRFGSAECGFLMSSHREFEKDQAWQYLRPGSGRRYLSFEPVESGLSELVVKPGWPHMAKKNRDDRSYATSDLFEPHPNIADAWRYHSRADSQITLITGKKFDPAPIEAAIVSSSKSIQDALIFGTGENYAGALLFPAGHVTLPAEEIVELVWPSIKEMNQETQSHARLTRAMLTVVYVKSGETALEKSSKGTILRVQAEKRWSNQIRLAYSGGAQYECTTFSDDEVPGKVANIVDQVLSRHIEFDQDLFGQGVDSVACVQIRGILQARFSSIGTPPLPLNVVYDCGSVASLSSFIRNRLHGQEAEKSDELRIMQQLVEQYSDFGTQEGQHELENGIESIAQGEVVVLTGATGALGAHLLHLLRSDKRVTKIYCLLRAQSCFVAHERVTKSLQARGNPGLDPYNEEDDNGSRVKCFPCKFSERSLGLKDSDYARIASSATVIIHAAWAVNFNLRLQSFVKDHIAGTRHLLDLATKSQSSLKPVRFLFISSTASVVSSSSNPILELVSDDPANASPLGYSRSKWIAEGICEAAHRHLLSSVAQTMSSPVLERDYPVSVLRVGQLCGDTIHGIWNASEAYPLMLSSAESTGCLPDLPNETLNWLPVDLAAKSILEIAFSSEESTSVESTRSKDSSNETVDDLPVYHILNPHQNPTWHEMLQWIQEEQQSSTHINILPPDQWIKHLTTTLESDPRNSHPSKKLLSLWQSAYLKPDHADDPGAPKSTPTTQTPEFATTKTKARSQTIKTQQPLTKQSVLQMYKWITRNVQTNQEQSLPDQSEPVAEASSSHDVTSDTQRVGSKK